MLHRVDQDVAFWLDLARRETDAAVLELACGTGRLTHALAKTGIPVVGLDNDPVMLAAAAAAAAAAGLPQRGRPIFVAGDMRRFWLARRFHLIFVGYNSLQLLTDTEDMARCLTLAREHLAPGGVVGVEVTDFQLGGADGGAVSSDGGGGGGGPPELLGEAEGIRLWGTLVHDLSSRTSTYRRHFSGDDWQVDNEVVVRSLDRAELERVLKRAGLTTVRWWADGAMLRAVAHPGPAL